MKLAARITFYSYLFHFIIIIDISFRETPIYLVLLTQ